MIIENPFDGNYYDPKDFPQSHQFVSKLKRLNKGAKIDLPRYIAENILDCSPFEASFSTDEETVMAILFNTECNDAELLGALKGERDLETTDMNDSYYDIESDMNGGYDDEDEEDEEEDFDEAKKAIEPKGDIKTQLKALVANLSEEDKQAITLGGGMKFYLEMQKDAIQSNDKPQTAIEFFDGIVDMYSDDSWSALRKMYSRALKVNKKLAKRITNYAGENFLNRQDESKQETNIMENKNTNLAKRIAEKIEKMTGKKVVLEKWAEPAKVADSKKGMFKGKSKEDLKAELAKLKKKKDHTAADTTKMKELNFALRSKSNWGKVKAEATIVEKPVIAESKKDQAIKILTKQIEEATGKKVKFQEAEEISNNTIGELTVGEIIPPASAKIIRDYVDITLNEINAKVMELSEIKKDIGVKGKATGEDWNQKTQDVQFRIKQLERVARFVNNSLIAGKFDKNILDKVIALTADADTAAGAPATTPISEVPMDSVDTNTADAIPVV